MNLEPKSIRFPRAVWWVIIALTVVGVLRVLPKRRTDNTKRPEPRVEQAKAVDWKSVDESIRRALEVSHDKACSYAESAVVSWITELRTRAEEDFLPWYFAYWNQQALMLRSVGYTLMDTRVARGITGKQLAAEQQLGDYLQAAFTARVLQPGNAQRRVDAITREAVAVYLKTFSAELRAVKVEYTVSDQDWQRHLKGLPEMLRCVEGNRQVPLILKGLTMSSGIVSVKVVQAVTVQIRKVLMRRAGHELIKDGVQHTGRYFIRGFGWAATLAISAWDLYDHHRTVSQNLPIMRKILNSYFDELGDLVLNDPQYGILKTLEAVQQELAGR